MKTVVLDAMGVIYSVADDVHDLLCPFIAKKGGSQDISKIERLYIATSLGHMPASEFWKAVSVSPEFEDEYLQRHKLMDGCLDFIVDAKRRGIDVWCLSNDISEWSKKLRLRFRLEEYITAFIVSGDVGFRKPDPAIFQYLLAQVHKDPHNIIFVDDNARNLDSAAVLGFKTVLFGTASQSSATGMHKAVMTFTEIKSLVS
jgi:putative hydrolase of the HAD superfamily